mmetsp:Transcript_64469/g.153898  ORF Transcript_64469/g.153898 Transcript_64469/m.153898 type:complete len:1034 (-) Transcript_64469:23-3124(-)
MLLACWLGFCLLQAASSSIHEDECGAAYGMTEEASNGRVSLIAAAVGVAKEAVLTDAKTLNVDLSPAISNASTGRNHSAPVLVGGDLNFRIEQPPGQRPVRRPWKEEDTTELVCGDPGFAPSGFRCPAECPFRKPDAVQGCYWSCVSEEQCATAAPEAAEAMFADPELRECRRCGIIGCSVCQAGEDACETCVDGFTLQPDGTCLQKPLLVRRIFVAMLCLAVVCTVVVYFMFLCADHINMFNLSKAEAHREMASLRSVQENHEYYDILTDLRKMPSDGSPPVGGPGLLLLFNYQFSILVWVVLVIVAWMWVTFSTSPDLLLLGTSAVEDPVEVCQAVRWGTQTRDKLRLVKATFIGGMYLMTFIGALLFARSQRQRHEEVDHKTATMMDFALELGELPVEYGPDVEDDIAKFIKESTDIDVVGVSVAWDFREDVGEVLANATAELRKREMQLERERGDLWEELVDEDLLKVRRRHINARVWVYYTYCLLIKKMFEVGMGRRRAEPVRQSVRTGRNRRSNVVVSQEGRMMEADRRQNGTGLFSDQTRTADMTEAEIESRLIHMGSSGTAFAVFKSEHDRDKAMALLNLPDAPLYKRQRRVVAVNPGCDPENIAWENYGFSNQDLACRIAMGILVMMFAICAWTFCFYMPYAQLEIYAYSTVGNAPHYVYEMVFSLVVCVGNLSLYLICSLVAENAGFRSREKAQGAYVVLYTMSVFCNIAVDISISAATAYWWLKAQGVRNDDGVLISDLPNVSAVLMSYPMQKALARLLFYYNFPTSFIIPYICESIGIIAVPYHLAYRVVISYKMPRPLSENLLEPMPMDLSRYGDVLVNVTLATLSLFLSSGLVLWNFLGLLLGNVYIFCYDHYRVLRHVGQFYFSCGWVDSIARRMLSIPCGILAACLVFQLYGMGIGTEHSLWMWMALAFASHVVLHICLYDILVENSYPESQATQTKKHPIETSYYEVAKQVPGNWFTENPVHCLRSQFIHKHDPPCMLYVKGKEYNLPKNEKLGLCYSCPPPHMWSTTHQPQQPAG